MSITDLDLFWQKVLELTKQKLPPQQSLLWESKISAWLIPYQIDPLNNSITLATMEKFQKNFILKNRLSQTLQEAINEVSQANMTMVIIDMDEPIPVANNEQTALPIDSPVIPTPPIETKPVVTPVVDNDTEFYVPQYDDPVYIERTPVVEKNLPSQLYQEESLPKKDNVDLSFSKLDKECRFDNYVVGNSNRPAFAAAQAVAENPTKAYNPLFIYGESGVGKTHLMHAIGNAIVENDPSLNVVYITTEKFTNMFVDMVIRSKKGDEFRKIFDSIDVLLIDDIQFLERTDDTQLEFFNRFNDLLETKKQIILSSDTMPKDMKKVEDRIRTRFQAAYLEIIYPPDLETRIAILRNEEEHVQKNMPSFIVDDDVKHFIAMQFTENVRKLQGAWRRVVSQASKIHISHIELPFAMKELEPIIEHKTVTVIDENSILDIVSTYFNIKKSDLLGKRRQKSIAVPRHIAIYFCRTLLNLSYPQIGEVFNRDHTTALHAFEKIYKEREKDRELKGILEEIHKRLTEL